MVSPHHARDSWVSRITAGIAGDIKYAVRRLLKERGFAAIALLTLALCIGANTAIFSMVYALILKPLPFPAPTRIVEVYNAFPKAGFNKFPCNVTQYADFKANTTAFEAIAVSTESGVMVGEEGSAEHVDIGASTAEMWDVLGIKPIIGEFYTLKNSRPGENKVVVLTEPYWKSHYNEDPGVIGKTMRIDGDIYTIIGVAPKSLGSFDAKIRFVRPISWKPDEVSPNLRYSCSLNIFGRLKPGVTAGEALGQVAGLEKKFYDSADANFKGFLDNTGHKIGLGLLQAERVEPLKASLYLLEGGVVFVLLIGCVNVANLLLTRANGQQSELAVRAALGAGRGAIARQLLVESLLLTLVGAALGVALAFGAVRGMNHFTAKLLPNNLPIEIDGTVLAYAVGVSVAVGAIIGLLPVIHILRSNLAQLIHRSSRSVAGNGAVRMLSSVLVTGQVAVALVLLCGAGLLVHSFAKAISVSPGFDPANVVVGSIALPSTFQDKDRAATLQRRLEQGLKEIPGVDDEALATGVPFDGGLPIDALGIRDSSLPKDAAQPAAYLVGASRDYFKALHIQLLEGRFFDETDLVKGARQVYVVDERFQKNFFPGRSAIGGNFTFGGTPKKPEDWPIIIGVVRNVPHNGVEDKTGNPFVYYPVIATQPGGLNVFVRSSRPTSDVIAAIRDKLHEIEPSIPLFNTRTAQSVIDESLNNRRALMLLIGAFAGLAMFLSAIGIYGVLAYDVSQRTREIGIRGAIGASRSQIVGLVVTQGAWKTGVGLIVGLVGAVLLSHYMASMLFDLKPTDPVTYAGVSLLLAAVALLASYIPARRAAAIDPNVALRVE